MEMGIPFVTTRLVQSQIYVEYVEYCESLFVSHLCNIKVILVFFLFYISFFYY